MESNVTANRYTEPESNEEEPFLEAHQLLIGNADLKGFDSNQMINHSHERGFLVLLHELKPG